MSEPVITPADIESFAAFCVNMVSQHKACVLEEMLAQGDGATAVVRIRIMALGSGQRVSYDFPMADIAEWIDRNRAS